MKFQFLSGERENEAIFWIYHFLPRLTTFINTNYIFQINQGGEVFKPLSGLAVIV